MPIIKRSRQAIKNLVFGDTLLPQEFTVGMTDPRAEICVWLHGSGKPLDVTSRHSTACSDPFTLCIAFEEGHRPNNNDLKRLSLKFCERGDPKHVLGEIGLGQTESISVPGAELLLFRARSATNYCLSRSRLSAHYLLHAYSQWRGVNTSGMKMSFLDRRAAIVSFIRPHPVMLVSVAGESGGNIFPMNIMGELGNGRYAFALKDSRRAAHLVEGARRVALSSVPISQAAWAYRLAVNHFKESIIWEQLPFATRMSSALKIPVPAFTPRVREMEIERVHRIGSHTLFLAQLVFEESFAEAPELCVIHGFYQAWRLRGRKAELETSLREDSLNKGLCASEKSIQCAA
jgi:hypothetical protein